MAEYHFSKLQGIDLVSKNSLKSHKSIMSNCQFQPKSLMVKKTVRLTCHTQEYHN